MSSSIKDNLSNMVAFAGLALGFLATKYDVQDVNRIVNNVS